MSERAWRVVGNFMQGAGVAGIGVLAAIAAIVVFGVFSLAGCAVGFDPEGRPVVGMGIGESDADAVKRTATGLAKFLPAPWDEVAVWGISGAFAALGIGSARSAARNSRQAADKQREADAAYDEATAAKVRAAESEGRHAGFDEGAARTAPVTVVPGPVASRVAGSVPA